VTSDSIVSIHALTEEDLREDDEPADGLRELPEAPGTFPMDSGPVTIDDLRASVWAWCHEKKGDSGRKVREFSGEIVGTSVRPKPSRGEKKKNTIIQGYSRTEEEMAELRQRTRNRGPATPEEMKVREQVQKCYSACMCQKYLDEKHWPIPEFINDVDFSEVRQQRKAEIKAWKEARRSSGVS
jgi:hypothetical protein